MIEFDLHHPDRRSSAVSLENILKNYTADNDCSISSGGGLAQDKSTAVSTLSLDFTAWLQTSLERFGVDAALYVRCVCSILRQPPESNSREDDFDDLVEDYEFTGGAAVFINDGNVGGSGQALTGVKKSSAMRDDRRTALVECLKSIDDSPAVVHSFADEILHRYKSTATGNNFAQESCTKKCLNESNDSGVCASPVDALAVNYEEEFPPLCDSFEEIKLISAAERDPWVPATQTAAFSAEDGRRPLLRSSYPTFLPPVANKPKFGSFSAFAHVSSSPPQFVLPKCERVGSGPSKLAAKFDVPLWQCTCAEWFCPIHKAVELSALASRVCKNAPAVEETTSGRSLDELFDAPKFILGIICEDDDGSVEDQFNGDQVRFVQPMIAPPAPRSTIGNNDQISSLTKVNNNQQQQLIPVTPRTHFVPIRSESMEDCFQSKPFGLDEELAATVGGGGKMSMTDLAEDETRFVYHPEADGGCFPLTFKALNPSVALQTEPERSCGWSIEEYLGWPADETQFALELAEIEEDDGKLMKMIASLQHQDDQDDDRLLQYVSNISLISPLNT